MVELEYAFVDCAVQVLLQVSVRNTDLYMLNPRSVGFRKLGGLGSPVNSQYHLSEPV